jgi:hypothetical protein
MTQEEIKTAILDILNSDFTKMSEEEVKDNFAQKMSDVIYNSEQDKYDNMKDYVDDRISSII